VIWVGWRRQRTETAIAAAMLAAIAALLLPTGIEMASRWSHDGLSSCLGQSPSFSCDNAINSFTTQYDGLNSLLAWFTLIPGLVGVMLAAPFVAELESGTYRLAWTQSITRRRWIATKLGLAVCAALVAALTLTVLMTWWHTPLVRLEGRMDASIYDGEGVVVLGYTLFALAIATAVGVLWRRAVPSLVVGFGAYFAARLFVDTWLRQRLLHPLTAHWAFTGERPAKLNHAWVISEHLTDRFGHAFLPKLGDNPCIKPGPGQTKHTLGDCLAQHGALMQAVYHPASRFWALQGIETAMFAGAAVVLLVFAAWWTQRRAA
jgi:hypothetical protein